MEHPDVTAGARSLIRHGFRITSIFRQGSRASGHGSGRAMDIAKRHYTTNYSREDARVVRDLLTAQTGRPWLAVAEQDHIHAEIADAPYLGEKNRRTNNELIIEQGDPFMTYGPSYAIARAARRLNIARMGEFGDPIAASSIGAPMTDLTTPEMNQVVLALRTPDTETSKATLAVAQGAAPELLDKARQIAMLRSALARDIKYIDYENAKEITSSIGNAASMRQSDVTALASIIAAGIPAFEPQVFDFTQVGAKTWEFYPAYALSVSSGGPLLPGELFNLIGSILELTVPVLTANVGLQVGLNVEFGPVAMAKNSMTALFRLGAGNDMVKATIVHGVQAGGVTRLQQRLLTVTAGAPTPGVTFPRITLTNLPGAAGYLPTFRFFQPGDRSVDRFSGLLD